MAEAFYSTVLSNSQLSILIWRIAMENADRENLPLVARWRPDDLTLPDRSELLARHPTLRAAIRATYPTWPVESYSCEEHARAGLPVPNREDDYHRMALTIMEAAWVSDDDGLPPVAPDDALSIDLSESSASASASGKRDYSHVAEDQLELVPQNVPQFSLADAIKRQKITQEPKQNNGVMSTLASQFWGKNKTAIGLLMTKLAPHHAHLLNNIAASVSGWTDHPLNPGPLAHYADSHFNGRPISLEDRTVTGGYSFPGCLISARREMFAYEERRYKSKSFKIAVTRPLNRTVPATQFGKDVYVNSEADRIYWFSGELTLAERYLAWDYVRAHDSSPFIYFNDDELYVDDDALPFHVHAVQSRSNVMARLFDQALVVGRSPTLCRAVEAPLPLFQLTDTEISDYVLSSPYLTELMKFPVHDIRMAHSLVLPSSALTALSVIKGKKFITAASKSRFVRLGDSPSVVTFQSTITFAPSVIPTEVKDTTGFLIYGTEEWVDYVLERRAHRRVIVALPYAADKPFSLSFEGVVIEAFIHKGQPCFVYLHTEPRVRVDGSFAKTTLTEENFVNAKGTLARAQTIVAVPRRNTDGICVISPGAMTNTVVSDVSYEPISHFLSTILYRRIR